MDKLKGQIISADFIIGLIVFTAIFIFFQLEWSSVNTVNPLSQASAANLALDRLLETPGVPLNWELNSSNASSIGLTLTPDVVSNSKLQAFLSICGSSYDQARSLIGLGQYDFQFQISNQMGNQTCGSTPKTSSITYLTESVLWNSNVSTVKLVVWP